MNGGITLVDFLKEIKRCPDQDLPNKWGVYDNILVLLQADFEKIKTNLDISKKFKTLDKSQGNCLVYNFTPQSLRIAIINEPASLDGINYGPDELHLERAKLQENLNRYNMHMMISFTDRRVGTPKGYRALANTLDHIGTYIIRNNIPASFPTAVGWDYLESPDYTSRIPFNTPKHPEKKK